MSYSPAPGYGQPQTPYASTPPPPPPKTSATSTPLRGPPLPPPPPGAHQNEPSELDASPAYQQQHQQNIPAIPTIDQNWLPEIVKDKTTADLHALLQDPSLQAALLENPQTTHPAIPTSQQPLEPLINQNIHLANNVSALESHLNTLRARTQSRLLSLKALEQQHRTKVSETEDALSSFSPMALYQRLSAGVQEQDLLVRGLEESWFEEEGIATEREVSEFVRRVKEAKKVAFLRRERLERWDEGRVGGWR